MHSNSIGYIVYHTVYDKVTFGIVLYIPLHNGQANKQ